MAHVAGIQRAFKSSMLAVGSQFLSRLACHILQAPAADREQPPLASALTLARRGAGQSSPTGSPDTPAYPWLQAQQKDSFFPWPSQDPRVLFLLTKRPPCRMSVWEQGLGGSHGRGSMPNRGQGGQHTRGGPLGGKSGTVSYAVQGRETLTEWVKALEY